MPPRLRALWLFRHDSSQILANARRACRERRVGAALYRLPDLRDGRSPASVFGQRSLERGLRRLTGRAEADCERQSLLPIQADERLGRVADHDTIGLPWMCQA